MSTPTIEVGSRWLSRHGSVYRVTAVEGDGWRITWEREGKPDVLQAGRVSRSVFEPWTYLGMAATPGTAAVTPAPECECTGADNRHWGECPMVAVDNEMRAARAASKPPASPAYGRLVGELRAPDGTPKLREVSANGRDWINYDRLTDSDAFEAYRFHRVTMSDGTFTEWARPATPKPAVRIVGTYGQPKVEGCTLSEGFIAQQMRNRDALNAAHRTPALEAIQAKREPEPWLPSCDIDCDIPDADEGWRR